LATFRNYFTSSGYPAELETDSDVVPFVVPYFDTVKNLEMVVSALSVIDVETDIYHFDIQRNMLEPEYRKCVPIPVHQGIDRSRMQEICQAILKVVGAREDGGESYHPRKDSAHCRPTISGVQ
jgi:hypothetical protein